MLPPGSLRSVPMAPTTAALGGAGATQGPATRLGAGDRRDDWWFFMVIFHGI